MTDEEVNIAVARKLGWKQGWKNNPKLSRFFKDPDSTIANGWINPRGGYDELKDYCHDIAAALEILECQGYWHIFKDDGGVTCILGIPDSVGFEEVTAQQAPMAICLAFLKVP